MYKIVLKMHGRIIIQNEGIFYIFTYRCFELAKTRLENKVKIRNRKCIEINGIDFVFKRNPEWRRAEKAGKRYKKFLLSIPGISRLDRRECIELLIKSQKSRNEKAVKEANIKGGMHRDLKHTGNKSLSNN